MSFALLGVLAWWGESSRGSSLFFFVDLSGARRPGEGAVTALSSFALAVAGALHLLAARVHSPRRGAWSYAAFGLFALALDELLMFHEWITRRLDALAVPRIGDLDRDVYVFATYALAAALVGWRLLPEWRRRPAVCAPLIVGTGLAAASQILDLVPWHQLSDAARRIWGPAEEILKSTATFCGALYSFVLLECLFAERAEESCGGEMKEAPAGRTTLR